MLFRLLFALFFLRFLLFSLFTPAFTLISRRRPPVSPTSPEHIAITPRHAIIYCLQSSIRQQQSSMGSPEQIQRRYDIISNGNKW
jgi:hypothetical protein